MEQDKYITHDKIVHYSDQTIDNELLSKVNDDTKVN